jgi:hypothetical protein
MRIFFSLFLALSLWGEGPQPVRWRARAEGAAKVHLVADVAEGWHLYSMKEIPGGPKATRIELVDPAAWEWAAAIEAPEPELAPDTNFGTEVEYYVGEVDFVLHPRRKQAAKPLALRVRYQCCSATECLPPKTEVFTVAMP